ncbi:MAG: anaerobic dehydrogenase [Myxococcaceae bacterium]|nr:anaerobic dehydrogenase [Myxococcaceae bacterium]
MQQDVPTACCLCSHNCGLRVDVRDNRVVAVRADPHNPISRGYSCNKGFSIARYIEHAQRVQSPLRRRDDGSFEQVSWDAALAEIGQRLAAIVARSPQSFAFIGGGGQGNHLDLPYATALRLSLGSPWWFNALGQEKTQHPLVDRWLFDAPPEAWLEADIEHSAYVVLLGTNPALSNRGRNATRSLKALHDAPERTLVVVDPRRSETAALADLHIALRPGSDVFLLLGMAAEIVQSESFDRAFLKRHVVDSARILAQLRALDVAEMARRCEIELTQLRSLARSFAAAPSACLYMDLGLEQGLFSTLSAYLMRVLLVLTGNLGRRGGGVFHGTFSPASPPLRRTPFRAPVSGIESIEALGPLGMFSPNLLPEEVLRDHPQRIRAVIVEGANPVVQYADSQRYRAALTQLELLVVIDPALSETARLAHFVLPTPVGYEKWEYSGFPKHYPEVHAQVRPPVVTGPALALPEAEIYARLWRTTGRGTAAPRLLHKLARQTRGQRGGAAFMVALVALASARGGGPDAILARMIFWAYETLGLTLPAPALTWIWLLCQLFALTRRADVLRAFPAQRALKNPFALGGFLFEQVIAHPEGTLVGRLDPEQNLARHCRHRKGKVRLSPEPMLQELARALSFRLEADADFPFVLNGGRRTHWNANTIQRDPAWRKGKGPHCSLFMHPADAERLALLDGARVRLETARGAVELPLRYDGTMRVGHLAIPNGFGLEYPRTDDGVLVRHGVSINELTDSNARDPFTGSPHHKFVRCRVVPVANPSPLV